MVDVQAKARHCALMLLAAAALADCAPDDVHHRALARYCFLYAEALLLWARRWRNDLKRVPGAARRAATAKKHVDELRAVLDGAGEVRHYLAAKRKSVAEARPDDMALTWHLWAAVNPATVSALCAAAQRVYTSLTDPRASGRALEDEATLPDAQRLAVRNALPPRDPEHWHLAADTAADLRPHTLPAAQGGDIGRLVAQVNDVAGHLDVLLRIGPVVDCGGHHDLLVRSAMLVELSALLDLTVGAPPGRLAKVTEPLVELCRQGRSQAAADGLERLRASIGSEGWAWVRDARNTLGAHVDDDLTIVEIVQELTSLDYQGVIRLAEHALDWLDALGATQIDLSLLLIGEQPIGTWTINNDSPDSRRPEVIPGGLADLFRTLDSPFLAATASPLGSPILAAMTQRRVPNPRAKITVKARPAAPPDAAGR